MSSPVDRSCSRGGCAGCYGQTIARIAGGLELGKIDPDLRGGFSDGGHVVAGPAFDRRPDHRDAVARYPAHSAAAQLFSDHVLEFPYSDGCGVVFLAPMFGRAGEGDDFLHELRIGLGYRMDRHRRPDPAADPAEGAAIAFRAAGDPAFGPQRLDCRFRHDPARPVLRGLEDGRIEPDGKFDDVVPERRISVGDQGVGWTMRGDLAEQAHLANDLEHVLGFWLIALGAGIGRLAFDHQTAVAAELPDPEWREDVGGLVDEEAVRSGAQEIRYQRLLLGAGILEFLAKAGPHRRHPEMLFEDAAADPGAPAIDIVGTGRRRIEGVAFV